jgi:hypothetical protein
VDVKVDDSFDRLAVGFQMIVRHPSKDDLFEVFSVEQTG